MATLAFASPELFERTLIRATAGAAVGGLGASLLSQLTGAPALLALPLMLGCALAALGTVRGALPLGIVGLVAGAVVAVSTAHTGFYVSVAGAVAGIGLALSRYLAGDADAQKLTPARLALLALLGAAALLVGGETVAVFESRQLFDVLPMPVADAARAALVGFFFSLSAVALHVQAGTDRVDALYDKLAPELSGELARLSTQAIELYRRCREALARSPQSAARAHVGRALAEVTSRALELAKRWHAVDVELGERAETDVDKRLAEVRKLIASATDATARKQLQAAEKALGEEQAQIQRIRAGRERVLARLHADLAILERTRFALLALRCTDAHLVATELSHLSENLGAMGRDMDGEAQAIDDALRGVTPVVPVASADVDVQPQLDREIAG